MKRRFLALVLPLILATLGTTIAWSQGEAPQPLSLDKTMRAAAVDSILAAIDEIYVFPEVAAEMGKLVRGNLASGAYDDLATAPEFAARLTEDLQSISHDLHLHVDWMPPRPQVAGQELSDEEMDERYLAQIRRNNFGFREVKLMPGNVAYIKLDMFAHTSQAGPTAIAAMNLVGYADAVIFDLTENGGGSPSMIQLLTSYLVEEPTHLNSFYVRQSDETNQFWTQAYVPGPKMAEAPVYVLTSGRTFSAAEEFTYNLKNLERATIVGVTTGGGAHPVMGQEYPDFELSMSLPFGRAVNPVTGTNWEGTGIEPHIAVPVEQALDTAYLDALKTLSETADGDQKAGLDWTIAGLEAAAKPAALTEIQLAVYAGQYGPRRIWIEDGTLWYQREERGKFRLVPMGDGWFMLEGLEYFRIEFEQENEEPATALIGHYDNGRQDQNTRTDG